METENMASYRFILNHIDFQLKETVSNRYRIVTKSICAMSLEILRRKKHHVFKYNVQLYARSLFLLVYMHSNTFFP